MLSNPLWLHLAVMLIIRVRVLQVGVAWQIVVLFGVLVHVLSLSGLLMLFLEVRVEKLGLVVIRLKEDGVLKVRSDIHWGLVVLDAVVSAGTGCVRAAISFTSEGHSLVLLLLLLLGALAGLL